MHDIALGGRIQGHGRHPLGLRACRSHHGPAEGSVIGFLLPSTAPGWLQWAVYLTVMLPIYQLLLLGYGTVLGQFDFFWGKLRAVAASLKRFSQSSSTQ